MTFSLDECKEDALSNCQNKLTGSGEGLCHFVLYTMIVTRVVLQEYKLLNSEIEAVKKYSDIKDKCHHIKPFPDFKM